MYILNQELNFIIVLVCLIVFIIATFVVLLAVAIVVVRAEVVVVAAAFPRFKKPRLKLFFAAQGGKHFQTKQTRVENETTTSCFLGGVAFYKRPKTAT